MTTGTATLSQLLTAIEVWNAMQGMENKGRKTFSVPSQDMMECAQLFVDAEWTVLTSGPLANSRYFKSPHGFVVQSPSPINELSLIQPTMAAALGIS